MDKKDTTINVQVKLDLKPLIKELKDLIKLFQNNIRKLEKMDKEG